VKNTMRLDKVLGHSGHGSRKDIKALCKAGAVLVNGTACRDSSVQVDPANDEITVQGRPVCYARFHYVMMDKPAGVVSATRDPSARTVLDLLPPEYGGAGMFPVGRLDKDTTGLLLLTNDGTWAHRITSPKKHIDKIYEAAVDGAIPVDIQERFASGLILDDGMLCLPARADTIGPQRLRITVQEGKFHQVKRMCAAVGLTVLALRRLRIGNLGLDKGLQPGAVRVLTEQERDLPFQ
jgi:16S rRNA pseudouridine516 synthase